MATATCWCGSTDLRPFNTEYGQCGVCGTLVSRVGLTPQELEVRDDDADFYGKQYWLKHQESDLGFPDIHARARNDLTERNLHWLRALLKYVLPPASVLELGCAHGSFVALLQQCGFAASGVEMSPWIVEFGRKTFGVPISVGPIEDLAMTAGSLDAIALMDVLEHLPDPAATMAHCLRLLKPEGVLLIQTPQFRAGMKHADLVATNGAFLEQLKADEHLYLFTEHAITLLFQRLGALFVQFEPAIFAHYDMFVVVSRAPLRANTSAQAETALLATPRGRIALALLDLRERETELVNARTELEADRTERGKQNETLSLMLAAAEADRSARGEQIETLTPLLQIAEADRTDRARQIEVLTRMLQEAETDRANRGEQVKTLTQMLEVAEADRAARGKQIQSLDAMLRTSEADRAERAAQIEAIGALLRTSEADRAQRARQIETLTGMLRESETDRAARGAQIELLNPMLQDAHVANAERARQMDALALQLREAAADRAARSAEVARLGPMLQAAEETSAQRALEIDRLTGVLQHAEAERAARGEVIEATTAELRALFQRRAFAWLLKFASWPEAENLAGRIKNSK